MSQIAPSWITIDETCKLLNLKEKTVKDKCRNAIFAYKVVLHNRRSHYYIKFDSLPVKYQNRYLNIQNNNEWDSKKYSEAPNWAQAQADKYITIINQTEFLKGQQLVDFINEWNLAYPELATSYPSIIKMRRRYDTFGLSGLLSRKGQDSRTSVADVYYEYFKTLYLKEGSPSLRTCWELTLGYAIRVHRAKKENFPSLFAFKRRIEKEIPTQSIYMARKGETAWNRKYGCYIERDYSNVVCGKVWVSDHAQIDVACKTPDGKIVFPWVTAWRDYKSGKWLGWLLQCGHPNSDHIFQTFYYAAENYGLPSDVIIDNGKDYRSKDFAGGRVQINVNQAKTTSMLKELNVNAHFALPYNAQTKPIERDFLKIKNLLSKHCVGYRGGNVVERPEILAKEIKEGKIMDFDKFKALFDDFIINVYNKHSSQGKNLKGLSPDELFNQEFKEKVVTSRDALKLFCMRTSKNFTIIRNGIQDKEFGITYWADWMIGKTGLKVYLRRDVNNYKEAWAFRADNDEFVGKVKAVRAVAALHADTVSKEEFKEAMAIKKRNFKIAKAYIQSTQEISIEEKCANYKAVCASNNKPKKPKITKLANTNMDKVIRKNKEMEALKNFDLSLLLEDPVSNEKPIYLFETDRIIEEELKGVNYGY
ncbi:MAG: Mu transposase C-terminal domain-containing protein [Bacilli bacterium]|nr:Mu transposase C-terminal domain-containing protein [bacterium]MBR2506459.1 Mu transposase C-terminal domain-containing protein [Bacilli bacterium]